MRANVKYRAEVRRGREELCFECRESILIGLSREHGKWIPVSLGLENGLDTIEVSGDNVTEQGRRVVDEVAKWTEKKEDEHDHREWLEHVVTQRSADVEKAILALVDAVKLRDAALFDASAERKRLSS